MNKNLKDPHLILFGEELRKIRNSLSMSQEDLAEIAKIDRSYLGGIERGEHNLALINIIKISHALNINPKVLLECFDNQN